MELLLRLHQRLAPVLADSSATAKAAAPRIVGAFCEALGWACGTFWSRDAEVADRLVCWGAWGIDAPGIAEFLQHTHGRRPILNNAGIVGSAWLTAMPVWVADTTQDDTFRRVPIAMRAGLRSALAFPLALGGQVLGVIEIHSTVTQPRDDSLIGGLPLLGAQVTQFLLRAQALQQVSESERRLRCLTALSTDWFWEQDEQLRFVRFEGHGAGRSGAALAGALLGRRWWEVQGLVPGSSDWEAHRAVLGRHESYRDFECVYRDDGGAMLHISAHGDAIVDADGRCTGYRGTARDLSLHKQAAQRIQYLSTHDELTGLPNRAALRQLVAQAVELAKRYERCFALLIVNVDRFQRMNDSLGRDVGDALLREIGARLKKQLRASDVVARLDGDEFAVLAHELPTPEQAEPIALKLLEALSAPIQLRGQGEFRITACVGIACYPLDAPDEGTLMKHAGQALRAAKLDGMNRLRCHGAKAKGERGAA
jgi:diguanylate cyclase (GGDEF)-like protein